MKANPAQDVSKLAAAEEIAIKNTPNMPYRGEWLKDHQYTAGEVVLRGGRFWYCNSAHTGVDPQAPHNGPPQWTKVRVLAAAPPDPR